LPRLAGLPQLPKRVLGARREMRPHAPTGQHLFEDEAVGRIVIDDQHPQTPQVYRLLRRRDLGDSDRPPEARGEVKDAPPADLALEPESPVHEAYQLG